MPRDFHGSSSMRRFLAGKVLSSGLVWSTPDGGVLCMRMLCASIQDMAFGDVRLRPVRPTRPDSRYVRRVRQESRGKLAAVVLHVVVEPRGLPTR